MTPDTNFDVIIIGGSYSGLSAAMALGRSLRTVLIIDSGSPCNQPTPRSHNFITHDGETPANIAQKAREQVLKYDTIQLHNGLAISGTKSDRGFEVTTQSGMTFYSKKLLFATGIKDIMPNIQGFADCWGITAIHCPYCHGYEFRKKRTGIMVNGERAMHLASLVNNLSNDITIFTQSHANFDQEQLTRLKKHNISIVENQIAALEHENGRLKNVILDNGSKMNFEAIYAALPFVQHSDIPVQLGCELTEQGYIRTDGFQKTTVKGIFACGDNSVMMRSVSNAVATGSLAGAMINKELTEEQF
ncbi:NAD(P)/FAD-dependent oxidoreductase [Flavobacterium sp. Sd200]|uniref:NAD(P)/FAD-dependent oxidoreductase n=1 Tax=Flavobacterium sp. Sd200 TaxID=2692211 RepID=UPI00136E91F7|nr:NAD(P)/FAD-dependent oxidoreductase [Flavobacterium sp. Sd200]MXN91459.1 NAD(P)/FAD-dependent oxidoreductase [Flavobacterium sp. Sd200]